MTGALGIIAGGCELPRAIAESARGGGRDVFVLVLNGMTGDWAQAFPNEAVSLGVTGVPAVRMVGNDVPMLGALPYESYRRWVERALARADSTLTIGGVANDPSMKRIESQESFHPWLSSPRSLVRSYST